MTCAKQESNKILLQEGYQEAKQSCDKKMYPKLVLNKLKIMGNFTFIYIH
jgi:hypothetical protein